MAERKLVKHGPSTFMVSIPKKWIDQHNFQKGDSIQYETHPDRVTFFAGDRRPEEKSTTVDVTGLSRGFVVFMLRSLYRQGFQEITIKYQKPTTMHHRLDKEVSISSIITEEVRTLIGVEVFTHSRDSITLKQLAEPTLDDLKSSFRRVIYMQSGLYEELIETLEKNDLSGLQDIEDKHDAITKYVNYAIRVLHVMFQKEGRSYLMHALMQLEFITDVVKHFTRYIQEHKVKVDDKGIAILKLMERIHGHTDKLYFKWDNQTANELDELRTDAKDKALALGPTKEAAFIMYLLPLLETYRDLIVSRLCMPENVFET